MLQGSADPVLALYPSGVITVTHQANHGPAGAASASASLPGRPVSSQDDLQVRASPSRTSDTSGSSVLNLSGDSVHSDSSLSTVSDLSELATLSGSDIACGIVQHNADLPSVHGWGSRHSHRPAQAAAVLQNLDRTVQRQEAHQARQQPYMISSPKHRCQLAALHMQPDTNPRAKACFEQALGVLQSEKQCLIRSRNWYRKEMHRAQQSRDDALRQLAVLKKHKEQLEARVQTAEARSSSLTSFIGSLHRHLDVTSGQQPVEPDSEGDSSSLESHILHLTSRIQQLEQENVRLRAQVRQHEAVKTQLDQLHVEVRQDTDLRRDLFRSIQVARVRLVSELRHLHARLQEEKCSHSLTARKMAVLQQRLLNRSTVPASGRKQRRRSCGDEPGKLPDATDPTAILRKEPHHWTGTSSSSWSSNLNLILGPGSPQQHADGSRSSEQVWTPSTPRPNLTALQDCLSSLRLEMAVLQMKLQPPKRTSSY